MKLEIEVKLKIDKKSQIQSLRRRLKSCDAVPLSFQIEHDVFFDLPGGKLASADKALRMRIFLDKQGRPMGCVLTFKGPRKRGVYKTREEIELSLHRQYHATAQMLKRLGYHKVLEYQKRRESWQLDKCKVELDELPELGWFVEIEGPSEKAISQVLEKLQLASVKQAGETYVEMVLKYLESSGQSEKYLGFIKQLER